MPNTAAAAASDAFEGEGIASNQDNSEAELKKEGEQNKKTLTASFY